MVRRSATYISRFIGEVIDDALAGTNTTVTRYGRAVAEFTAELPEDPETQKISVTDFVATVGHWLELVDAGNDLILTRRNRPVVAVVPFKPQLGGYIEK